MEKSLLKQCFGTFITGVTIVTTQQDGQPLGFTANSFSSVSLSPPLLLICIDNTSENFEAFTQASRFGVNILADDQIHLSSGFSTPTESRFDGIDWHISEHGNPELEGVVTFFDCALETAHQAGDHTILIGKVLDCHTSKRHGLGYYQGRYFAVIREKK